MKRPFKKITRWCKAKIKTITPGNTAIKGASIALISVSFLLFAIAAITNIQDTKDPALSLFFIVYILVVILIVFIFLWILKKIYKTSREYKLALLIAIPLFVFSFAGDGVYICAAIILLSLLGAAIAIFAKGSFRMLTRTKKVVTVLGLFLGTSGIVAAIIGFIPTGFDMNPIVNAASLNTDTIAAITGESPAEKGPYKVKTLTYGSGKDKHRSEFAEKVTIQTDSVNGVAFLDNWDGFGGWYRENFWGFDAKSLPVNGYVWYPEGEGPFPLALIVHGNHSMQDFSDTGYAYLGELLASRGIIFVSVDENFFNTSWSDITGGLDEENDARGWMLLEHLRVWQDWNIDVSSAFYQKIDTNNLALLGHSRGGEAVGHAALLNKMPYYFDDATIPLDYNYNIKSIVAIAPVDGQYEPGNARTELQDLSYFVLHGSQDGDVSSFAGSKQYERVTFSDSTAHFKSGLYIQGANHGQFNTSWGDNDMGLGSTGLLNLKQLLTEEEQREIAKIYISAFLESTLKNNDRYRPLFADARTGKAWLPETIYLNQYQDANFSPLTTFDEDFDVSTTTEQEGVISSKNLSVWREQEIALKWGEKGSRAAYIGWHYQDLEDKDETEGAQINIIPDSIKASYTLHFPEGISKVDSTSALSFSLAESKESTDPKSRGKWKNNEEDEIEDEDKNEEDKDEDKTQADDEKEDDPEDPIDFTIILEDFQGQKIQFPLSQFSALQREIEVRIWKADFISGDSSSENVFQTFRFPLIALQKELNGFDLSNIVYIHFIFDKTLQGVIVIDDIGFAKSSPTQTF
ncbi:MAG: dienelactone hydrolase [Flavobacteriales bacterium]|jgi:dienelactone hydrolase